MTGLNHAVTGAFVATVVKEPIIAFPAALASHFLIDALPHWDYKISGGQKRKQFVMAADLFFALLLLAIISYLLAEQWWLVFFGGVVAIAPDAMWLPNIVTGQPIKAKGSDIFSQVRRFHMRIQWSESKNGLFFEIFWFVLTLTLLLAALS